MDKRKLFIALGLSFIIIVISISISIFVFRSNNVKEADSKPSSNEIARISLLLKNTLEVDTVFEKYENSQYYFYDKEHNITYIYKNDNEIKIGVGKPIEVTSPNLPVILNK